MRSIPTSSSPGTGLQVLSDTDGATPGERFSTLITIADQAVAFEFQNKGVSVHRVRGDGRTWFKVLATTPVSPVQGDVWLRNDSTAGIVIEYYDGTTTHTLQSTPIGGIGLNATLALLAGHAVRVVDATGLAYAAASSGLYRPDGICVADTLLGSVARVATAGDTITLADWSVPTGGASLTPAQNYWLSSTPGRLVASPVAAFGVRVGRALTAQTLRVTIDLTVLDP